MRDSVNIIFVSDHGMTEVSEKRIINVEKIVGSDKAKFYDDGRGNDGSAGRRQFK